MSRKGVAYLRVSTEMQVDGYSLDAQVNAIERYAKIHEIDIIDTYRDEGKSGTSIKGRERFIEMIEDIEADKVSVDFVMVFKLSRFGRNSADILNSLQRLQNCGVELICTEDNLDSSTHSGKLMITVLSAVAEIDRVNIVEQTLAGKRQKALEGKWNGGFPPYGYALGKDDILQIAEEEAKAVRIIYDKYVKDDFGFNKISRYLNEQGIPKIPRKNGTHTRWSAKLVKDIIDNPVHKGYIAYGRRGKEKVKGTQNEYRTVKQENYILAKGKHKAIITEELWDEAHQMRIETGVRGVSTIGRDRIHLLSGILRCPKCSGPMYTNRNSWTRKDGTYVEHYYYVCSRKREQRGIECDYRASLRKDTIEPDVITAIRALVQDPDFAAEVQSKIGQEIDTSQIDRELENYKSTLRQAKTVKETLEREIDTLPYDEPHRERKIEDLNKRLNRAYDELIGIEESIDEALLKREAVETNALNLEQVYRVLENFDLLFDKMSEEDKRKTVDYLIKEIAIHEEPQGKTLSRLKSITFNFPVYYKGTTVDNILWENGTHAEAIALIQKKTIYVYVNLKVGHHSN